LREADAARELDFAGLLRLRRGAEQQAGTHQQGQPRISTLWGAHHKPPVTGLSSGIL
jgi:hypothetical protein